MTDSEPKWQALSKPNPSKKSPREVLAGVRLKQFNELLILRSNFEMMRIELRTAGTDRSVDSLNFKHRLAAEIRNSELECLVLIVRIGEELKRFFRGSNASLVQHYEDCINNALLALKKKRPEENLEKLEGDWGNFNLVLRELSSTNKP
ncbi:MAG: hypothetical protein RLP09_02650 [Sandaracinaceae bacterium]